MRKPYSLLATLVLMLLATGLLKVGLSGFLSDQYNTIIRLLVGIFILIFGALYPLNKSAEIIEGSTDVLSKKTNLSSGLLQSLGTAFPDMILGITAALISLSLAKSDPNRAISYAMIAASTTFGSNIYNIGFGIWCIWRQNLSDKLNKNLKIFPFIKGSGLLKPLTTHKQKPLVIELDTAIHLLGILTLLTAAVALLMVSFGRFSSTIIDGDTLYQLIRPAGLIIFVLALTVLIKYRKNNKEVPEAEAAESAEGLATVSSLTLWSSLIVSGITIAFTAETMVHALETVSIVAHIPYVISGALAGIIGCLGEIIVIHNYSIHQNGRIGDAVIGIAMDNIVTIMGASIVAIMGGIFLGGTSLIVLFVVILTLNTLLIEQISRLKNSLI